MIFQAHVRERRDIFVTGDERGFIRDGHRERLQARFDTRIMTQDEFIAYCIKFGKEAKLDRWLTHRCH
jgi:hypothetical protein